jgi:hypothetical protein
MAMAAETSISSPFGEVYQRLVANGYSPLPISPMSKAPSELRGGKWRPMPEWQRFREAPASSFILRAWGQWPGCNVGIVTGTRATATHIVACVDFDTDEPDTLDELQRSLPPSPVRKKGKRGYSAFYLVPNGTTGFRTSIVELLTDTRQTVIPPSIHPDTGRPYEWTGTASLLDTPAAALPALNEDDIARFRDTVEALTKKPIPEAAPVIVQFPEDETTVWRRINNLAFANLDAWVPDLGLPKLRKTGHGYQAVAHWRASSTGRPIAQRNPNLSIMAHRGARDFGNGSSYTALDLVQHALSVDLDGAFQWLGSRLGLIEQPIEIAPPKIETPAHDPETGEIVEEPAAPEEPTSDELPEHLTRVPGILGDVVEWICRASSRPNRTLALGAALGVMASVIGKGMAGPQNANSPHLYILAMAPSGVGKDGPLKAITKLLKASSMTDRIGPSEFMSMSAVINFLLERRAHPTFTCAIDEFGAYLKRILSKKAGTHEMGIVKPLLQLWSCNHDDYQTPQWAGTGTAMVESPAMTIYGTTTPENFFAALSNDDTSNGFLNRFLLLSTSTKAAENREVEGTVPKELALSLASLRLWAESLPDGVSDPDYLKTITWATGRPIYEAFRDRMDARQEQANGLYFARTAEIAIRLAMIRAAGRKRVELHAEDMQWGIDVALWSSEKLAELAEMHMAGSLHKERHNRLVQFLRRKGQATRTQIHRFAFRSELDKRELAMVIDSMVEGGVIEKMEGGRPPQGGKMIEIYRLVR